DGQARNVAHDLGEEPSGQNASSLVRRHDELGDLEADLRQILDQGLGAMSEIAGAIRLARLDGKLLEQLRAEARGQEIEDVPILLFARPAGLPLEDLGEIVPSANLLDERHELACVLGSQV